MKTPEEIQKLAEQHYTQITLSQRTAFIKAYIQCQQDNADKRYTEEDLRKIVQICRPFVFEKDLRDSIHNKIIKEFKLKNNLI